MKEAAIDLNKYKIIKYIIYNHNYWSKFILDTIFKYVDNIISYIAIPYFKPEAEILVKSAKYTYSNAVASLFFPYPV